MYSGSCNRPPVYLVVGDLVTLANVKRLAQGLGEEKTERMSGSVKKFVRPHNIHSILQACMPQAANFVTTVCDRSLAGHFTGKDIRQLLLVTHWPTHPLAIETQRIKGLQHPRRQRFRPSTRYICKQ